VASGKCFYWDGKNVQKWLPHISSLHCFKNDACSFSPKMYLNIQLVIFIFVTKYLHLKAASHSFLNASGSGKNSLKQKNILVQFFLPHISSEKQNWSLHGLTIIVLLNYVPEQNNRVFGLGLSLLFLPQKLEKESSFRVMSHWLLHHYKNIAD
jgi:hypothetical protein